MIATALDMAGFIRDFKKITSKKFKLNLEQIEPTVLQLFMDEATSIYPFWKKNNSQKIIELPAFYLQKLNYIHNNPMRKGYVARSEHRIWSSANPDSPLKVKFLEGF